MFIEAAIDQLPSLSEFVREDQLKELGSLGDVRAQKAGASGVTRDFQAGYQLGLQTARVILQGSVTLQFKGINPSDVL